MRYLHEANNTFKVFNFVNRSVRKNVLNKFKDQRIKD